MTQSADKSMDTGDGGAATKRKAIDEEDAEDDVKTPSKAIKPGTTKAKKADSIVKTESANFQRLSLG